MVTNKKNSSTLDMLLQRYSDVPQSPSLLKPEYVVESKHGGSLGDSLPEQLRRTNRDLRKRVHNR